MWALSPPRTTDWSAFGRQVSGAWSVAWSPPLPRRTALLPKESVRGAILCIPPSTPTCPPKTPTGRPYSSPAKAGPEGLGCIRCCVGVGGVVCPLNPHRASLSLPGPGRTGGTRVYPPLCGGGVVWCPLLTPTGRPYPSPAQAGPEGLGCIRRCVGASLHDPLVHPTSSLHPTCDRGASPYFKAILGESDCWSCRQLPLPRRTEHRNGRRRPFPPPRRRLPFTPPSPSSRGPDRAPRRLR